MHIISSIVACGTLAAVATAAETPFAGSLRKHSGAVHDRSPAARVRHIADKFIATSGVTMRARAKSSIAVATDHASSDRDVTMRSVAVATDTYNYVTAKIYDDSSCSSFVAQAVVPYVTSCQVSGSDSKQCSASDTGSSVVVSCTTYVGSTTCSGGTPGVATSTYNSACAMDMNVGSYVTYESAGTVPSADLYNIGTCAIGYYPDSNYNNGAAGDGLAACIAGDAPMYYYQATDSNCQIMTCSNDASSNAAYEGVSMQLGTASLPSDSPAPAVSTSVAAIAVALAAVAVAAF